MDCAWEVKNVWNDGMLSLREPPEDNVYKCTFASVIDQNMAEANIFNLGFRCDYWGSGKFRVRNVRIIRN